MTRTSTLIAAALLVPLGAAAALAADPIEVTAAWLRATPKGAPVAGGYATITNTGATPDTLVTASLPNAPKGEIHSMTMNHGVMHMERLDKGLDIPPGKSVTLAPGGFHLMFLKPTVRLKEGETIEGTLTFAHAGAIQVRFLVQGMAAKSAPGMKAMPGMDMR